MIVQIREQRLKRQKILKKLKSNRGKRNNESENNDNKIELYEYTDNSQEMLKLCIIIQLEI